jgi:hypothetical protein
MAQGADHEVTNPPVTTLVRFPQLFPTCPPRQIAECNHCPEGKEHFRDELDAITLVIPVRTHNSSPRRTAHGRLSHRLHRTDALLCAKHTAAYLAQKEF